MRVYTDFYEHIAWILVIIQNIRNNTHLETVGINYTTLGQSLGIGKAYIVFLVGIKESLSLQEIYTKEKCHQSYDAHQTYFIFLFHDFYALYG